ncbi:hypothetical protein ILP92_06725 [Maribius pontilimi]|uniref:Uncharacterized protein n=1 Tax=Palleronia pontilimi TaxID=1964209 RepID=A0A934MDJ3_9RHOB|nr:hypothetical protein [Palleronia pontilimi]MBJ3762436.1 hypothetical protein [Palleronia pontilimi]
MSAHDLAQKIEQARDALRRAFDDGADPEPIRRDLDRLRQQMSSLRPEERAALWDAEAPVACLPVRLETAFLDGALCVRVYPDTIHLDDYDPRVPTGDHQVATAVAETVAGAPARQSELHRWMDETLGVARAVRARDAVAVGKAPRPADADDRPGLVGALADRWTLRLEWPGGTLEQAFPALVADPLPIGPSVLDRRGLLDEGALDRLWSGGSISADGIAWMFDFDAALAAGMAIRVDLSSGDGATLEQHLAADGTIDTVTVHGLRWATAEVGAAHLTTLMKGHVAARGLRVLPQGSATANDGVHRTPGPPERRGGPNLARLERAFGLAPETLALAGDTDHDEDTLAAAMATMLWPGSAGLWCHAALGLGQEPREAIRRTFIERLRARGPFSALQIGTEPYGVLPVVVDGAGPAGTSRALRDSDAALAERVAKVLALLPRTSVATDPPADRKDWLFRHARSAHPQTVAATIWTALRPLDNPRTGRVLRALGLDPDAAPARDALITAPSLPIVPPLPMSRWDRRLAEDRRSDQTEEILLRDGPPTLGRLFQLMPKERWPVRAWREMPEIRPIFMRADGTWSFDTGAPGDPLLFTLMRHALFTHLAEVMRDVLERESIDPPPLYDLSSGPAAIPLLDAFLDKTGVDLEALTIPLGEETRRDLGIDGPLAAVDRDLEKAMTLLARHPVDRLELAMREHLGLVSARPDAWITALDAARLEAASGRGILIAGAGRVFGLARDPKGATAGEYLLARSPTQAVTGAILRDGGRRRRAAGGGDGAFALDLGSARVRAATDVMDDLRAGRALGEVLGTRIEAALRAAPSLAPNQLRELILALRAIAPLREGLIAGVDAGSDLAATDVCDGIRLVDLHDAGDLPALPQAAREAIEVAAGIVDAIADLGLAEGVHAIAASTPERAGAALDAVSRGAVSPEGFTVARTQRAGRGLDVKVLLVGAETPFGALPDEPGPGDFASARAIATGPLADALASIVGPLDEYGAWVVDAAGPRRWVSLTATGLDAVSLVLSARAGNAPRHPLVEALLVGARGDWIDSAAAGPDGQPEFAATKVMLASLRAMVTDARGILPEDLPADPTGEAASFGKRPKYVMALAGKLEDRLSAAIAEADEATLRAALADAARFGRADAESAPGAEAEVLPVLATGVAARLASDRAAAADAKTPGDALRHLLGPTLPLVPGLPTDAAQDLTERIRAGEATAIRPQELRRWATEAASVRGRLREGLEAIEAAELLRDETLLKLCPIQDAPGPWAAMGPSAADTPVSRAVAVIGPRPVAPAGGLVLDDWSEVLPDPEVTAAVAVEAPSPVARAPQTILIATTDTAWSADAGLRALDRAFELVRLRATAPTDLGTDLGALPPVLSFQDPRP